MATKKTTSVIKTIDDFILVTMKNIGMALAVYDHFYIIEKKGKQWEIKDRGDVRPRLKRGMMRIENYPVTASRSSTIECFVPEEETPERYEMHHKAPLRDLVNKGVVYVHKTKREKSKYSLINNR
jgi:hypothetical protein